MRNGDYNQILFTAETKYTIAYAGLFYQNSCDMLKRQIARLMTKFIVNLSEVINIHQDNTHRIRFRGSKSPVKAMPSSNTMLTLSSLYPVALTISPYKPS